LNPCFEMIWMFFQTMLTLEEVCKKVLVNEIKKMGFWEVFGRVSREELIFRASQEQGARWVSRCCAMASECWTIFVVLHVLTFRGIFRHPYAFFMCCFDCDLMNWVYVIIFAWNSLSFVELKWTLRYIWTWI